MMNVPFFDNRRTLERIMPALESELLALLAQPTMVDGAQVRRLEAEIRACTGARFAVSTGNATDSLIISLMALGVGPGDEVIVPCYSFFASVSCILHVGATPVFVDIESDSYSLDPALVEQRITARTRAIMPVHLFRQMADMDAVLALARRHGLHVVEDSAEGIGMCHGGVHAGLLGDIGVLSFFPTKTLGALGDAGMILTQDAALAERARQIADNGRDAHGLAQRAGFNSRMDDLQALYLRLQLPYLEADIRWRAQCARLYERRLAPLAEVQPPRVRQRATAQRVVDYVYLIQTGRRDELERYLAQQGVGTEVYYPMPLHLQPACRHLGGRPGDFPVAEAASRRALGLPMHADLTEADIEQVCRLIIEFSRIHQGQAA
jgi:dTDP-4-amino-4,6-dideoxygalactose transaminase